MAACDAAAAGMIGRGVSVQLPLSYARDVVPVVLDPERSDRRPSALCASPPRRCRLPCRLRSSSAPALEALPSSPGWPSREELLDRNAGKGNGRGQGDGDGSDKVDDDRDDD